LYAALIAGARCVEDDDPGDDDAAGDTDTDSDTDADTDTSWCEPVFEECDQVMHYCLFIDQLLEVECACRMCHCIDDAGCLDYTTLNCAEHIAINCPD
jgi:hypothetical protein